MKYCAGFHDDANRFMCCPNGIEFCCMAGMEDKTGTRQKPGIPTAIRLGVVKKCPGILLD